MKKLLLLSCCFYGLSVGVFAQELDFADARNGNDLVENKTESDTKRFVFDLNSVYLTNDVSNVEPHFLGDSIAEKWTLVNELFIQRSEVEVGFGDTYIETSKPAVMNAIYKINNYYKKALHKGSLSESEMVKQFSWILDCAIAVYYSGHSIGFENELMRVREPEEILNLFNSIKLNYV